MSTTNPPLSPLILLDGGLGTTLTLPPYSVTFDTTKPLWSSHLLLSASSRTTLLAVQKAFVEAGVEVLSTDTYQASFEGFALSGIDDEKEVGRLMRAGVTLARYAITSTEREMTKEKSSRKGKGKVALSLGPYGATMIPAQEYTGLYDSNHQTMGQLWGFHLNRLQAFWPRKGSAEEEKTNCWDDVDVIAFETVPVLEEVQALRVVMGDVSSLVVREKGEAEKPFWISCVFPGEGNCLPDGSTVKAVVKAMLEKEEGKAIPMGIGLNCTKITKVEGLIREFEAAVGEMVEKGEAEWPSLVVYPDGTNGEVYNTSTKTWEVKEAGSELSWDETLFNVVSKARERRLWNAIYVGGCCKTTPVEIGKLRKRIDAVMVEEIN